MKDIVGKNFGKLKVLRLDPSYKTNRGKKWVCECSCGKQRSYYLTSLVLGDAKTCGDYFCRYGNLTGKRFGRWLVVRHTGKGKKRAQHYWECLCDCGTVREVRTSQLLIGRSTNCGCFGLQAMKIKNSLPVGQSALNTVLGRYKREAKKRNYEWDLSKEDFVKITALNCHYCGISPLNRTESRNGAFVYNGIDRVENSVGYTINNTVACCRDCNLAKYKKTAKDFLDYIKRVFDYQQSKTHIVKTEGE